MFECSFQRIYKTPLFSVNINYLQYEGNAGFLSFLALEGAMAPVGDSEDLIVSPRSRASSAV